MSRNRRTLNIKAHKVMSEHIKRTLKEQFISNPQINTINEIPVKE